MNNFEEINNYGELFLTKLYEPTDNSLEIEVRESFTSPLSTDVIVGEKTIKECSFNISFINYVAYQVLNESFYSFIDNENYVAGKYSTFCIFSESSYLDFILKETYAHEIFPKELRHYGLYCQNHVIHIIALNEPVITKNGCA